MLADLVSAGVLMTRSQPAVRADVSGIGTVLRTAGAEVVVPDASVSAAIGLERQFSGFRGRPQGLGYGSISFGNQAVDPIDRIGQIDRLMGELESGKKYGDDHAKYKADLAKWEEEIAAKEKELEKDFKKAKKARDKKVADAEKKGEEVKEKKYKEDRRPRPPKRDDEKGRVGTRRHG